MPSMLLHGLTEDIKTANGAVISVELAEKAGFYIVRTPYSTSGPMTYRTAWTYLNGYLLLALRAA